MKYVGANALGTSARDGAMPQQKNEKARMSLPFFDRHLPLCIHEGSEYFGGKSKPSNCDDKRIAAVHKSGISRGIVFHF